VPGGDAHRRSAGANHVSCGAGAPGAARFDEAAAEAAAAEFIDRDERSRFFSRSQRAAHSISISSPNAPELRSERRSRRYGGLPPPAASQR